MTGLLPVELWDYRLHDFAAGIYSVSVSPSNGETIPIPGLGEAVPARSARAGIVTAIKALGLKPSASVGVPLYCCSVVFKAIEAAGCKPRFLDVDAETFCLSPQDLAAKKSQVEAVIAVHMYGNVCDIPCLKAAAPDVPIIEDCALSLGSKLGNSMTGSLANVGVFSFRSGKYLSVGEGGAIFSNNPEISTNVANLMARLSTPSRTDEIVHATKTYLRSSLRSKPLYGLIGYRLWEVYNDRVQFSAKSPISMGKIYRSDLALTKERLPRLPAMIGAHRTNADYLLRNLRLEPAALCREPDGVFYNRYQFPITLTSKEERDFLFHDLHRQNIDTARPLDEIVGVARDYYGYREDCPVSERLSKQVLIIPSYHTITRREIERVSDCVNVGLDQLARRRISKTLATAVASRSEYDGPPVGKASAE
jgi:perosamine synthetase